MIKKSIIFLLLLYFISLQCANAQQKITIDIQVEDDSGYWGIGDKITHYLKDKIIGSNLYKLSNAEKQKIFLLITVRGFGVGQKGIPPDLESRYFAFATSWISDTNVNDEILPIFIAHQLSIFQYKNIEEAAEDIIVKTTLMKQRTIKDNPMLLKYIYW